MESLTTHPVTTVLNVVARYGRWCLVLGLLAGFLLPDLAAVIRPLIPVFVGLLLFLTAFRIGARAAFGTLAEGGQAMRRVLVLQLLLPLTAVLITLALATDIPPFLLASILMLAAPSVTGAPNFAIMNNQDPTAAMRILVIGTALFPLLVLPVFWLLPQLGGAEGIWASLRLITVILVSTGLGFALRHRLNRTIRPEHIRAVDGLSALALGIIVVGLMAAIGPLMRDDPIQLTGWIVAVFCLNFGLQLVAFYVYRGAGRSAVSMIAGNRNVALFLVALPDHVTQPLLIFIGCYQIPMYLTPILLRRLHDRA